MHAESSRQRKIPRAATLGGLLSGLLVLVVAVFIATAFVTGSATLPNGPNGNCGQGAGVRRG